MHKINADSEYLFFDIHRVWANTKISLIFKKLCKVYF